MVCAAVGAPSETRHTEGEGQTDTHTERGGEIEQITSAESRDVGYKIHPKSYTEGGRQRNAEAETKREREQTVSVINPSTIVYTQRAGD